MQDGRSAGVALSNLLHSAKELHLRTRRYVCNLHATSFSITGKGVTMFGNKCLGANSGAEPQFPFEQHVPRYVGSGLLLFA